LTAVNKHTLTHRHACQSPAGGLVQDNFRQVLADLVLI
jgi:hypothetical protein